MPRAGELKDGQKQLIYSHPHVDTPYHDRATGLYLWWGPQGQVIVHRGESHA